MKKFNIVTKTTYKDRSGNDKNQWHQIGSLVFFPANGDKPDGYKLELYMYPGTQFFVFEQTQKENKSRGVSPGYMSKAEEPPMPEISVDEIPF